MDHPFEVGKTYRNGYGRYQVISLDDARMDIRYEDGREINVTIAIQTQIWANIQLQEAEESKKSVRRKTKKAGAKKGPTKADKQEKLIAEILADDTAIFDVLTRLTIPPGQIDLYRLLLKNPDDYFSRQQIADAVRESKIGSQGGVFMAFGKRIGASSDPRVRSLQPYNSLFVEHKKSGGKTRLRIRPRVREIFATYPEFHDFLLNDQRSWLPEAFGAPQWTHNQIVYERQMQFFGFWDRIQDGRES